MPSSIFEPSGGAIAAIQGAHMVPLINEQRKVVRELEDTVQALCESTLDMLSSFLPVKDVSEAEIQAYLTKSGVQLDLADRNRALTLADEKLLNLFGELFDAQKELQVLLDLNQQLSLDHGSCQSLLKNYKAELKRYESSCQSDTGSLVPTAKVHAIKANPTYRSYERQKWQILHPGERYIGEDEFNDVDDEVLVTDSNETFTCPFTGRMLEDPVTSQTCHHSFSRNAIYGALSDGSIECPVTGCSQILKKTTLSSDRALAKKVRRTLAVRNYRSNAEPTIAI